MIGKVRQFPLLTPFRHLLRTSVEMAAVLVLLSIEKAAHVSESFTRSVD